MSDTVETITGDATFYSEFYTGFDPELLAYDEELGFLKVPEAVVAMRGIRLVGFGLPRYGGGHGGFDLNSTVTPIVDFDDLHPSAQNRDTQGMGVGPRLYNTPSASTGLSDAPERQGVYMFDINPDKLRDARSLEDISLRRIGRHGLQMADVEAVHATYGDAEAVLFGQMPRTVRSQTRERSAASPPHIPSEFIIIRSAAIALRRIGEYTIPHPA